MKLKALVSVPWVTVFAQIDLKLATMTINDGTTPTANSITVTIGTGNLTYTETKNIEYNLDRGQLSGGTIREGDEVPVEVSFDFVWEYITSRSATGQTATVDDALKQTGLAVAWVSSDSDVCQPYAVDLVVVYDPNCASGDTETITFPDFRFESLQHDLRAGTVSCSGKCNATAPTVVRSAASA